MRAGVEKADLCGVAALGGETPAGAPRARQTPTASVVLPYTRSRGAEAVALYERSGRTAMPWQRLMMEDIMAVNDEGLWVHMKFAWSIPRRNGKSELLIMCSLWALTNGRRVLYTAHRTTTSTNAWEKVVRCLTKAGFVEDEDFKTSKRQGNEQIIWLGGDGIINFRTRTSKGGLGEGYDLLIIDEAQEYTADQESALKYIVTDSKDPQTLMCGTPPTAVSAGDVFLKYRRDTLEGRNEDCGWAEWSVPALSDMTDRALWYETNPSLGYVLTERTVRNELGSDRVDGNIQRLGLWLTYSQKSAITRPDWMRCALEEAPTPGTRRSRSLSDWTTAASSSRESTVVPPRTGTPGSSRISRETRPRARSSTAPAHSASSQTRWSMQSAGVHRCCRVSRMSWRRPPCWRSRSSAGSSATWRSPRSYRR